MPVTITRQVRSVLESENGSLESSLADLLSLVDDFARESPPDQIQKLEDHLHHLHQEVVDHASCHHTQVFLAVLHHLSLPASSIISSWFDLVLRPALRDPNLPASAVNHAKELILSALCQDDPRVPDFRRRLVELYLLDAFNEGSGHDLVEWAAVDGRRREQQTRWKLNLEGILLTFGEKRPTVCNSC